MQHACAAVPTVLTSQSTTVGLTRDQQGEQASRLVWERHQQACTWTAGLKGCCCWTNCSGVRLLKANGKPKGKAATGGWMSRHGAVRTNCTRHGRCPSCERIADDAPRCSRPANDSLHE